VATLKRLLVICALSYREPLMPKGKVPQRVHQQSVAVRSESFTGPLPPPALLEQYERLSPGFAERIITSWEIETAHRHDLERKVVAAEIEAQVWRQFSPGLVSQGQS